MVHIPPVPLIALFGVVVVVEDYVVVFGVDHQDCAACRHLIHNSRKPAEVGLVVLHLRAWRSYAGGEYLEAGEAVLGKFGYLIDGVVVRALREDGVIRIVGVCAAAPSLRRFV